MTIAFNYPIICMHFLNKKNNISKATEKKQKQKRNPFSSELKLCHERDRDFLNKIKTLGKNVEQEEEILFSTPPVLVLRTEAIFLRCVHLGALKRKHEHLKTIKILNRTLAERQEQNVAVCARNILGYFDERLISEK